MAKQIGKRSQTPKPDQATLKKQVCETAVAKALVAELTELVNREKNFGENEKQYAEERLKREVEFERDKSERFTKAARLTAELNAMPEINKIKGKLFAVWEVMGLPVEVQSHDEMTKLLKVGRVLLNADKEFGKKYDAKKLQTNLAALGKTKLTQLANKNASVQSEVLKAQFSNDDKKTKPSEIPVSKFRGWLKEQSDSTKDDKSPTAKKAREYINLYKRLTKAADELAQQAHVKEFGKMTRQELEEIRKACQAFDAYCRDLENARDHLTEALSATIPPVLTPASPEMRVQH